jgi:hypothetical protein
MITSEQKGVLIVGFTTDHSCYGRSNTLMRRGEVESRAARNVGDATATASAAGSPLA